MARKYNDRYVRYYTFGSTAAELVEHKRSVSLPQYTKCEKRKPIPFDPVACVGTTLAVMLAVCMGVGMVRVAQSTAQVHELKTQIISLELEQQILEERYRNGYDLEEVRIAAASMGMIPAEEAVHISVEVPRQSVETPQLSWWESLLMRLRQFFA